MTDCEFQTRSFCSYVTASPGRYAAAKTVPPSTSRPVCCCASADRNKPTNGANCSANTTANRKTALAAIAFDRLHASIQEAIDAAPKDPAEQMRASGRGYVRFAETNPGLFRLMFNSSLLEPSDPDLQRAGLRAYMQLCGIAAPAAKLRGGNSEEDVRAVALQIWCTAHGFAHLLLEQQITAPPGGQSRASRLPDIAGLLLGNGKPPRKTKPKRR